MFVVGFMERYVKQCADARDSSSPLQIIGNGDIFDYQVVFTRFC